MTSLSPHKLMSRCAVSALLALSLAACTDPIASSSTTSTAAPLPPSTAATAKATARADTRLTLRIDGIEWIAEHDIFGAVHPTGYDRSIVIAGSRGGKNANEQAFTMTLFGIDAPGRHRVHRANATSGVAQMANLSPERFLAGNLFGYDIEVELVHFSKNPDRIEARFSGTLEANDGSTMQVSDGYFRYVE